MEIGLHHRLVELADHRPQWAEAFERERRALAAALGASALDIQHIGSTAVPGMPAKPILDIAVAVESYETALELVNTVENLGYRCQGNYGRPRRLFFEKQRGELTTHHLYLLEITGEDWKSHLRFRDALRNDPFLARRYADLKHRLADRHVLDREAYRLAKGGFIIEALRRARP